MLGYPLILLALLALTSISLVCVINNLGQIMVGFKSLPHHQVIKTTTPLNLANVAIYNLLTLQSYSERYSTRWFSVFFLQQVRFIKLLTEYN
jgi:hypothetical protein